MRAKTDMDALFRRLDSEARDRHYELLTDGALLGRFVQTREAPSFDELVRRHGPMVWGICQRILGPTHDADDAFQAVFLVLLRKAQRLQRRDLFAHWLCAVAYKTARHAQRRLWKIGQRERQQETLPEGEELPPPSDDWRPLFDAAVQRLPAKYREPVVLCELQGLSRAEAARVLKLNEGTLSSRLGRARDLLRMKLGRYGLPLVLGAALTPSVLPPLLATSTTAAALHIGAATVTAITLTKGVLTAMFLTKVKAVTLVTTCCALGLVAGFGPTAPGTTNAYEPDTVVQKPAKAEPSKPASKPADPLVAPKAVEMPKPSAKPDPFTPSAETPPAATLPDELKPLQGHWIMAQVHVDGKLKEAPPQQPLVEIVHNVMLAGERYVRLTVDPNTAPKRMMMKDSVGTKNIYCIYRCDGQTLTIAQTYVSNAQAVFNNKTVPVDFEPTAGVVVTHYRRVNPKELEDRLEPLPPRIFESPMKSGESPMKSDERLDPPSITRPAMPVTVPPPELPRIENRIPPPLNIPMPSPMVTPPASTVPTTITGTGVRAVDEPMVTPPASTVPTAVTNAEFAYPKAGLVLTTKQFQMPVSFRDKSDLLAVMLMMSADAGKTWQLVEMGTPNDLKAFHVTVPKAGQYHFAVISVNKNQKMDPPQIANLKSQLTVDVVDHVPGQPTPRETELLNKVKQLENHLHQLQLERSFPIAPGNLGLPMKLDDPRPASPMPLPMPLPVDKR